MNSKAKQRAWSAAAEPPEAAPGKPRAAPALSPVAGLVAFDVGEEAAGERLDRFLGHAAAERRLALSRTRMQALVAEGRVAVDGAVARDAALRLTAGSRVTVDAPPAAEAPLLGQAIPLDIRFEDRHLIVIDKPAGLVVHPAPGHADGTLVNALIAHCGASLSGIGGVRRPGIVHRLDKDTSGLLVVAKTDAAHQGLSALFADHGRTGSLLREYQAIVWGAMPLATGTVDAPLARHPHNREKMAVAREGEGRHAVTHWRQLEPLGEASLIACRLETGRTHQIRVHLAHVGHPLLGDGVYGAGFRTKAARLGAPAQAALKALGRQALHAARLGFEHPVTGETLDFASEPPGDFQRLAAALRAG